MVNRPQHVIDSRAAIVAALGCTYADAGRVSAMVIRALGLDIKNYHATQEPYG